jgi:hypothetical protein
LNYFEKELRRVAAACGGIIKPKFSGNACYGALGVDNRAKLQFAAQAIADHYDALKATILDRSDGEVDTMLFRFRDIWDKRLELACRGGFPHIWTYNGKSKWYIYRPTDADIRKLAAETGDYLAVFADHPLIYDKYRIGRGKGIRK